MSNLILILDDELSYANMLSELLEDSGYVTDVCTNPHVALERLQENSYGLIISDFKMPECDGAEFILQLRKILPQIPVIVVSGLMGKPDLLRVANIGVELVLEKPFNVPAFLDFVGEHVQRGDESVADSSLRVEKTETEIVAEYPTPLKFLADRTPSSKTFLNHLWKRVDKSLHTILHIPRGGEVDLIAREVAQWLGFSGSDPLQFTYGQLQSEETLGVIKSFASNGESKIVILNVPEGTTLEGPALETFYEWTKVQFGLVKHLRFIHALPNIPDAIKSTSEEPLLLPGLNERLADLSVYAKKILADLPKERSKDLTLEAVKLLLQHPWSGNYSELSGSLYRASVYAGNEKIGVSALGKAIEDQHGDALPEASNLNLKSFLHAEQKRFVRDHLGEASDIEALRELAGSKADRIQADRSPLEQPLLFSELTSAK